MSRAKRAVKRGQKRPMVKRKGGGVTPPPVQAPAPTQEAIASLRKVRRYPTKDPDAPRGDDPLIKCKKCKVWSARRNYCSNCKEVRR